jgi:hypothetical protein
MPVLVLAAPMTGRTWLVDALLKENIRAVDLDAIMHATLKEHELENAFLPVIGLPVWYDKIKRIALKKVPLDAEIYVGGNPVLPFVPDFLCKNDIAKPLKIFLRIPDLENAYRRKVLPFLPTQLHHVPVAAVPMILAALFEESDFIPHFYTFKKHYSNLAESVYLHMTAEAIVEHFGRVLK